MNHTTAHRALAIAGAFQAAWLAQQIARRGSAPDSVVRASIGSIFQLDPDNATAVFGGNEGVSTGLKLFSEQLAGNNSARDPELLRYVINLLHLERRLSARGDLLHQLRDGIAQARDKLRLLDPMHDSIIASLAQLYQATISTLAPRIIVHGEPAHLADQAKANLIRALLLAGIRAAVLWRQCSGRRWRLLLQRGELLNAAQRLLASCMTTE